MVQALTWRSLMRRILRNTVSDEKLKLALQGIIDDLKKVWRALEENRTEALNIMEEESVTAKMTIVIFSYGDTPKFDAGKINI